MYHDDDNDDDYDDCDECDDYDDDDDDNGSPWSAPAWMKSNNALNGQV